VTHQVFVARVADNCGVPLSGQRGDGLLKQLAFDVDPDHYGAVRCEPM
jgi:hypothetical protein